MTALPIVIVISLAASGGLGWLLLESHETNGKLQTERDMIEASAEAIYESTYKDAEEYRVEAESAEAARKIISELWQKSETKIAKMRQEAARYDIPSAARADFPGTQSAINDNLNRLFSMAEEASDYSTRRYEPSGTGETSTSEKADPSAGSD